MRTIAIDQIRDAICRMVQRINIEYPDDIRRCMETALQKEQHPTARSTLQFLIRNAAIAREERLPICQDTGMAVIFLRVGQDVHFTGGSLRDAIDQGVAMGYEQGYLRKSVVDDPLFERINTRTNTPAIVYTKICEGEQVEILVGAKGFGSENMSTITMLKPAQGIPVSYTHLPATASTHSRTDSHGSRICSSSCSRVPITVIEADGNALRRTSACSCGERRTSTEHSHVLLSLTPARII